MSDNNYNNSPGNPYSGMPPQGPRREMSVKDWAITMLIIMIPCVGTIMLLIWAFSANDNITRSNFAKGYLITWLCMVILMVILYVILYGTIIGAMLNSGFY